MGGQLLVPPMFHIVKSEILNHSFLKKYLNVVSESLGGRQTSEHFNFKCNVCGDSKISLKKKRGFILMGKYPWVYMCHNCNISTTAEKWLKKYYPHFYKQYIRDILQYRDNETKEVLKKKGILRDKPPKKDDQNRIEEEKKAVRFFRPILIKDGKFFKLARNFCEGRRIPKIVWKKWFVASDEYHKDNRYNGRIIIPFFDNKKKIYYYQARTLTDQEPKYLNRATNKANAVYNYYNIDKGRPVIVLEGPIDSLFIKNSIATLGLGFSRELKDKLKTLDAYFIFDNDGPGRKMALGQLRNGKSVFIWSKFLKDHKLPLDLKDINDAILKLEIDNFYFNQLKNYFTKSVYDSIYF